MGIIPDVVVHDIDCSNHGVLKAMPRSSKIFTEVKVSKCVVLTELGAGSSCSNRKHHPAKYVFYSG